jgi:hypothetical protein
LEIHPKEHGEHRERVEAVFRQDGLDFQDGEERSGTLKIRGTNKIHHRVPDSPEEEEEVVPGE